MYKLTCPKCKKVQYPPHCGNADCTPCNNSIPPKGKLYQIWAENGNDLSCPYCGFTVEASYWEDRYVHGFLKSEGVRSFGELQEKRDKQKENNNGSIR